MNVLQKLRQTVQDIQKAPARSAGAWELAGRLLGRLPADLSEAERVVAEKDLAGLDRIVTALENPAPQPARVEVSADEMDRAFKAFKKRIEVSRLAEESKLGGRQLTGGRRSRIDAMIPPREFSDDVWRALAEAGRLKYTGHGFYALAKER